MVVLVAWQKTAGLVDEGGRLSRLGELFKATWPDATLAWQLLWVNTVFRFATAAWYVHTVGAGHSCTVPEMVARPMSDRCGTPRKSAHAAVYELVGLVQLTPIGTELWQGRVLPTRPRAVQRAGLDRPERAALAYAAQQLFLLEARTYLSLAEHLLWTWVVFGRSLDAVFPRLASSGIGWLRLDETAMWLEIPLEALRHEVLF